jgi:hypothetical protein
VEAVVAAVLVRLAQVPAEQAQAVMEALGFPPLSPEPQSLAVAVEEAGLAVHGAAWLAPVVQVEEALERLLARSTRLLAPQTQVVAAVEAALLVAPRSVALAVPAS